MFPPAWAEREAWVCPRPPPGEMLEAQQALWRELLLPSPTPGTSPRAAVSHRTALLRASVDGPRGWPKTEADHSGFFRRILARSETGTRTHLYILPGGESLRIGAQEPLVDTFCREESSLRGGGWWAGRGVQKLGRHLAHGQPRGQRTGLRLMSTCREGLPPN